MTSRQYVQLPSTTRNWLLSSLFSLCLIGCGGGGNSVSGIDGSGAPATASTPTFSTGTISGFGSVIINGTHFNSDKATILINGVTGSEDDLRAGYQVAITGETKTDGTTIATTIEYFPVVIGKISAIDSLHKSLKIAGLVITTNSGTLLDSAISPNFFDTLKVGDNISVSGDRDGKGNLVATRISYGGNLAFIAGTVTSVDANQSTLIIDGITVNFSSAKLNNVNRSGLMAGINLRVKGNTSGSILIASDITLVESAFDKTLKLTSIEGRITRFASSTDYDVNGKPCSATSATNLNGATINNIYLGAWISAKGTVSADGKLLVDSLSVQNDSNTEVAGEVTQTTSDNNSAISTGKLIINGQTIQTTLSTTYEDRGSAQVKRFNFTSIVKGDFLQVSGYTKSGIFYATKIERQDIQTNKEVELELRGIFVAVDQHSFSLLGRTVLTSNKTQFKDTKGENASESLFYASAAGKLVRVKGILINGIFTATEVSLAPTDSNED